MDMRQVKLFDKTALLLLFLTLATSQCLAQYRSSLKGSRHYIALSLAGAEANDLTYTEGITSQPGAGASVRISYEWQYKKWLLGAGVEARYQYLRDTLQDFTDAFNRKDRVGTDVRYLYNYLGFKETDQALLVSVPVYFGREIGDYMYVTLGATFSLPLLTQASTVTRLYTEGEYGFGIGTANSLGSEDFSFYGYYPIDEYTQKKSYKDAMRVSADVEIGGLIPIESKQIKLRAGIYGSYAFRFGTFPGDQLVDYSAVEQSPTLMTQQNLKENIHFESIMLSNRLSNWAHNLEVGVRLTLLFDVTGEKHHCMCNEN